MVHTHDGTKLIQEYVAYNVLFMQQTVPFLKTKLGSLSSWCGHMNMKLYVLVQHWTCNPVG